MPSATEYHAKAARMRELSAQTTDPALAETLTLLAEDYEAAAAELERTPPKAPNMAPRELFRAEHDTAK